MPTPQYLRAPQGASRSVRAAFEACSEVLKTAPIVSKVALWNAFWHIAQAERMQARVDLEGLTVLGSRGQIAPHPLLAEIRMHQVEALKGLAFLGGPSNRSSSSAAGAALASKRWTNRSRGRNPGNAL